MGLAEESQNEQHSHRSIGREVSGRGSSGLDTLEGVVVLLQCLEVATLVADIPHNPLHSPVVEEEAGFVSLVSQQDTSLPLGPS